MRNALVAGAALALTLTLLPAQAQEPVTTASGLIYKSLKDGNGKNPAATDTVRVHYRGTFPDGREFDSSYKRGKPIEFPLNRVIKCWTEGVQRMKVGGKAQLVCPPSIAYGEQGRRQRHSARRHAALRGRTARHRRLIGQPGLDGARVVQQPQLLVQRLGLREAAAQQVQPLLEPPGMVARQHTRRHQRPEAVDLRPQHWPGQRRRTADRQRQAGVGDHAAPEHQGVAAREPRGSAARRPRSRSRHWRPPAGARRRGCRQCDPTRPAGDSRRPWCARARRVRRRRRPRSPPRIRRHADRRARPDASWPTPARRPARRAAPRRRCGRSARARRAARRRRGGG